MRYLKRSDAGCQKVTWDKFTNNKSEVLLMGAILALQAQGVFNE